MRVLLAAILLASCGGGGGGERAALELDMSAAAPPACPVPDMAAAPPVDQATAVPDMASAPPGADMAVCWALACARGSNCVDYVNATNDIQYLTCCAAGSAVQCHDALGVGESCARSVCAPGATCADGFVNGGTVPLVLVCCSSPASAPALRCASS